MIKVDMSAEAVTARLKRIEQLRRLCLSLGKTTFPSSNKKDLDNTPAQVKEKEDSRSR
jgi:hypothetical protein